MYNWYAVKGIFTTGVIASTDTLNLCPAGWHVPTDGEWTSLIQFTVPTEIVSATVYGIQSPNAGGKLKSTSTLWSTASPPSSRTDNFGFSGLPGGFRDFNGRFFDVRDYALFWSATEDENDISKAWFRDLDYSVSDVYRGNDGFKSVGSSVRCLRD